MSIPTARPRIVLIEDNIADVELFRMALEDVGLNPDLFVLRDGGEALQWAREASNDIPNLAVVDLNLPKHDGMEVLEAMRENPLLADLPALVLSSSPSPHDMARVATFSNTRYLTKPTLLDQYMAIGRVVMEMLAPPKATAQGL